MKECSEAKGFVLPFKNLLAVYNHTLHPLSNKQKEISSVVKRLIAINRIQNKSFCLHNMCMCNVIIYYVYIYKYTHIQCIYFENIYMYIYLYYYILYYIKIYLIYKHFS